MSVAGPAARCHAARLAVWLAVLVSLALPPSLACAQAGSERSPEAARMMNELMTGAPGIGGPFELTDPQGRRSGTAQWRGKAVLLYFGYTFCPDACPTELAAMAAALEALGRDGQRVQPVLVTLDPARDRPATLAQYVGHFGPTFQALTGTEDEIRTVARAYRVYFEKVTRPGTTSYLIDHTSFVYLLDPDGRLAGWFPPGTSGERMAQAIRPTLAGRK